jgi:hypothetical protein
MKKILTMAAALFTFSVAFSQGEPANDTKTFSIGPAVGFGHTGLRKTTGTDVFKPSWSAGVILNYSTSENIGIAADVLWSVEGARVEIGDNENDLTLQYIRVPLKFVYFFGDFEDDFRPKITVGPSLGFLIDASNDMDSTGTTDVTSFYEKFDIGLNASLGFNWKLGTNMWLNTDLNYYTGFIPVRGDDYNSNFGIRVGLAFGL